MTHRPKRSHLKPWMLAACAVGVLAAQPGRAATLVGSQVSYVSFNNLRGLDDLGGQVVRDGTVFDNLGLRSFLAGDRLVIQDTQTGFYGDAAFNGPQFVFHPGGVTGASTAPGSATDFGGVVSWTTNSVAVDYAGQQVSHIGSAQVIDVASDFGLAGQPVTYRHLYPDTATVEADLGTLPFVPTTTFMDDVSDLLVAIGANTITVVNLGIGQFPLGQFGGPVLTFSGIDITGATIDPISAADFYGDVSTTGDSVTIDFAHLAPGLGHALVIDVQAAAQVVEPPVSAVPEPAGWALMIAGLGGAGGMLRRRRRRRALAAG